jgi:general secretion pathway protein H
MNARFVDMEGYTLLEMIVVLALLGLILSITLPWSFKGTQSRKLHEQAITIATMLKSARMGAITRNRESSVEFDLVRNIVAVKGGGEQLVLDRTVRLKMLTARQEASRDGGAVRFFPNGSSTGGTVILQSDGRSAAIRVDWLTGKIERAR